MADEKLFETEKHCFEFIFHGHLLCTLYYSKLIPQKGKYQIQDGFRVICQLFALTMAESCFNHIPFDVWIKLNQSTYIKLYQVGSLGFFGQITSIIFPSGAKIGGGYGHPMAIRWQVWSMDRSFHQSFAALSGSFDGPLELWDLRGDEPLQSCPTRSVVERFWWIII